MKLILTQARQGILLGKYVVRMPCGVQAVRTFDGSFDCVAATLRVPATSLRMTNSNE